VPVIGFDEEFFALGADGGPVGGAALSFAAAPAVPCLEAILAIHSFSASLEDAAVGGIVEGVEDDAFAAGGDHDGIFLSPAAVLMSPFRLWVLVALGVLADIMFTGPLGSDLGSDEG
jgi:hypothetical protein